MELTVIVVAMIAQHLLSGRVLVLPDYWYERFSESLKKYSRFNQLLDTWLLVLLPPVLLFVTQYFVDNPYLWWIVDILVLFYAFGTVKMFRFLTDSLASNTKQSDKAFNDVVHALALVRANTSKTQWFIDQLAYVLFSRFFVLIFWYVLLGSPAVLLVHLLQLQSFQGACKEVMSKVLFVIELPVLKFLQISFSFMGDFAAVLDKWLKFDFTTSCAKQLSDSTFSAAGFSQNESLNAGRQELFELLDLMQRCRLLWLAILAAWYLLK
jgi:membrane protein required for beta-lactamase induction